MNEQKTLIWWRILCSLAVLNLLLWGVLSQAVDTSLSYVRWHLILSGIYTAVCAFRSFLPRIDLERYCLVDSEGNEGSTMEIHYSDLVPLPGNMAIKFRDLGTVVFSWNQNQVSMKWKKT